jgi:hypothetical protein
MSTEDLLQDGMNLHLIVFRINIVDGREDNITGYNKIDDHRSFT